MGGGGGGWGSDRACWGGACWGGGGSNIWENIRIHFLTEYIATTWRYPQQAGLNTAFMWKEEAGMMNAGSDYHSGEQSSSLLLPAGSGRSSAFGRSNCGRSYSTMMSHVLPVAFTQSLNTTCSLCIIAPFVQSSGSHLTAQYNTKVFIVLLSNRQMYIYTALWLFLLNNFPTEPKLFRRKSPLKWSIHIYCISNSSPVARSSFHTLDPRWLTV